MSVVRMSRPDRIEAINAYNARYGEMDSVLWCLSRHCRATLLKGQSNRVVEELVWTVKSWWGIQGVERATRERMAQALATMPWSEEMFEEASQTDETAAKFASVFIKLLVTKSQSLGVPRREVSLASKVLHWLLPWHIPVFDNYVRESLGVSAGVDPYLNYHLVATKLFQAVQDLEDEDTAWLGGIEPRTPLRALDKCLWWLGGGSAGTALVAKEPWSIINRLGLRCN